MAARYGPSRPGRARMGWVTGGPSPSRSFRLVFDLDAAHDGGASNDESLRRGRLVADRARRVRDHAEDGRPADDDVPGLRHLDLDAAEEREDLDCRAFARDARRSQIDLEAPQDRG